MNREYLDELQNTIQEFHSINQNIMDKEEYLKRSEEYGNKLEEAKQEGLRKIGEGSDRITFLYEEDEYEKDLVIKMSKSDGTMQNRDAIEVWKRMNEEARENVAHLIEWKKYEWIAQEFVGQNAPKDGSGKVAKRLAELGWISTDIQGDNIGVKNERPVLLDLGILMKKS